MENKNLKKLSIIAISLVVIIFTGFLFMEEPVKKYKISSEETLEVSIERADLVSPEKFMHIYYTKDSLYRFVDLRHENEFVKNSLPDAINIPVNKLLSEKYENIVNQDKKINIFYSSKEFVAFNAYMILKQIGYKNNRILQGDYEYIKKNIIDNYAPMNGYYKDEKARYDFAKIVNEKTTTIKKSNTENINPAPIKIKKEIKKEEEGGC